MSQKDSQDWDCPRERGHLPKGRRDESPDIVASLKAISGTGGSMTEACVEPGWRVNDIVLAAKVLQNVQPSPSYANEAEMRRVFGLVYDVLRCETWFSNINVDEKRFSLFLNKNLFLQNRKMLFSFPQRERKYLYKKSNGFIIIA